MVAVFILINRYPWIYAELFKQIKYNILVKIALGLDSLDEIPVSPARLFNFQNRLNDHFVRIGKNLLEKETKKVTLWVNILFTPF